ncbi:hypothetical protein COLU111180_06005 [Cohnella lubricantis]|uniref:Uncharacterized protein n=1 Tax=Cohnella lubricantis TaxID=2163172 RepID=A0A841TC19_9BACL|nr:hypothetical protein [Cohnella lubricantis]MBB6677569.1 hypothetical protein [Cohnella lubricantis]MBP2116545.1 MFS family permease [Cohnella lubricantis]
MNIMLFVPHILVKDRFDGAVMSLLAAIAIGSLIAIVNAWCFQQFPQMGLPEILDQHLPKVLSLPLIAFTALTWMSGGIFVVYSFTRTMGIFFNPEMNEYLFLFIMVMACLFAGSRSSRSVQFALEVLLLLCAPLGLFILFKTTTDRLVSWDAMRVIAGYVRHPPSFRSVAAATFLFSGYLNMQIFNRLNPPGFRLKHRWLIPLLGASFAFFTFFIPIGFHGTIGVDQYMYLWSVTADSMVLKYGFVQRVVYLFLLVFSILSLMFVMNTYHCAMEMFKACWIQYQAKAEESPVPKSNWIICAIFGALSFAYASWSNDQKNQWATEWWLIGRFCVEIFATCITLIIVYLARKKTKVRAPRGGTANYGK